MHGSFELDLRYDSMIFLEFVCNAAVVLFLLYFLGILLVAVVFYSGFILFFWILLCSFFNIGNVLFMKVCIYPFRHISMVAVLVNTLEYC